MPWSQARDAQFHSENLDKVKLSQPEGPWGLVIHKLDHKNKAIHLEMKICNVVNILQCLHRLLDRFWFKKNSFLS